MGIGSVHHRPSRLGHPAATLPGSFVTSTAAPGARRPSVIGPVGVPAQEAAYPPIVTAVADP